MRRRMKRRLGELAIIMVAVPLLGWALEEAAKRVEARKGGSTGSRWLHAGADLVGGAGRGPLAKRLRAPRDRQGASGATRGSP